ncbi:MULTISPECIES: DUF3793 family protein [Clostridium]|uniref:DUF3793 family protein n=1 Tax=Clostridium TaxID=1485 RepID=UPI000824F01C|nr:MULTISPECIES: DUF3793 family protein [Clostridium]PJI10048.1 DUF3793 domain-containing protein [Clostridium sp. CT7]
MSREQVTKFFNIVNEYDDFEYLLYIIICNCGPTLKKQKIASLVTFSNDKRKLNLIWNKYKDRLRKKLGVSFFELRRDKRNIVVLFYNYEMMEIHIKDKQNIVFLNRFGYKSEMNVNQCLCHLKRRFEKICPHEIGVFLGYPIEDVISFMDCNDTECKMVGYWKVYHNVEKAKVIFNNYDSIKESIIELILKGYKPTELMSLC